MLFRGTDNHIHELFDVGDTPGWGIADLTAAAEASTAAASDPVPYMTNFSDQGPTARVLFRGTDNHIHELSMSATPRAGA